MRRLLETQEGAAAGTVGWVVVVEEAAGSVVTVRVDEEEAGWAAADWVV